MVLLSRAAFDGSAWRHLLWGCAAFFRLLWVELPFFLVGSNSIQLNELTVGQSNKVELNHLKLQWSFVKWRSLLFVLGAASWEVLLYRAPSCGAFLPLLWVVLPFLLWVVLPCSFFE